MRSAASLLSPRPLHVVPFVFAWLAVAAAPAAETEDAYYKLVTLPAPRDLTLEVTGIAPLPDGRVAVCIRKGEVWIIDNADAAEPSLDKLNYTRFASGLHEPLGLAYHKGSLYVTQRAEVTRLADTDRDGVADEYRTVATGWGVSGNYHEYAYGPVFDDRDNLYITLNCTIGKRLVNDSAWRGWCLRFTPDGKLQPVSAGLRSPIGLGKNHAGDLFGTDHQGNWFPTCPLFHITEGAFHGHTDSLADTQRPGSPLKHPGKIPTGLTVGEAAKTVPGYKLPAVWLPYKKMGMGATAIVCDSTDGRFGPFKNQLFVGDFTMAQMSRVFLEKVGGEYQGACFPFRKGFDSAVVSMALAADGSMFVGETNRGWNSIGSRSFGLQRLRWTGKTPFEITSIEAKTDGFLFTFTAPIDRARAADVASYDISSYTYPYHAAYGGDEISRKELTIKDAQLIGDRQVKLTVDGLRASFVHEIRVKIGAADGRPLLHDLAYYTLNRLR